MQAIALIFVLAVLTEGTIEYFGAPIPAAYKRYAALLLAIVVCVLYGADLLALLGYAARYDYVGNVVTGLIVGRGSNYLNDMLKRISVVTAPAQDVDTVRQVLP